jgi:hypothetical protein
MEIHFCLQVIIFHVIPGGRSPASVASIQNKWSYASAPLILLHGASVRAVTTGPSRVEQSR